MFPTFGAARRKTGPRELLVTGGSSGWICLGWPVAQCDALQGQIWLKKVLISFSFPGVDVQPEI